MDQSKAQLTVAETTLSDAGHQLALAQANFQRDDSLVKSGLTPRKTWDESHTTLLQQQDQQREDEAQLLSQRAATANALAQRGQVQVLDRQIDMQRKQLLALQAQADQLKQEISDSYAAFAGGRGRGSYPGGRGGLCADRSMGDDGAMTRKMSGWKPISRKRPWTRLRWGNGWK